MGAKGTVACSVLTAGVMAICGDAGFMMNSQELETAVRLKLNLVVLIVFIALMA